MIALQMNFFDEASEYEKMQTKSLLMRYRRHKTIIAELEKIEELAPKQEMAYNAYLNATLNIDRAVRLIIDPDIKEAIQMRFIDGIRRKDVVRHYRFMDPSTVDRRINRGIESIANSMKVFES